jgi:hypothetical protein
MFCQNQPLASAATRRRSSGRIEVVPKPPPESTKISLRQRLNRHAQTPWPALTAVNVRYHGVFAYIDANLGDGALECACGLYLNDPTAWLQPPTNY